MIIKQKVNLSLRDIPKFVKNLLKQLGFSKVNKEIYFDIKLCLEESLINAVKHGNKMIKDKSIYLKIKKTIDYLDIEVQDQGSGFNYRDIPSPTDKKNLEKSHGRGIFLIKNLMDEVKFFDGGRRIKMIRYWKRSKGDENH